MKSYIGLFLSALTGVLLGLTGIHSGVFAWVAFVPVCVAVEYASPKRSIFYGAIGGACAGALLFYGVILYGVQYYVALILYAALQGALSVWVYAELLRKVRNPLLNIFVPPLAWVFFEYLKTIGRLSFPMPLGASQYNFLALLQFSSIAGIYGVSLIIVWVNRIAVIWIMRLLQSNGAKGIRAIEPRPAIFATAAVSALLAIIVIWGHYVLGKNPIDTARGARTAVLQGNVPIQYYWRQFSEEDIRDLISNRYFNMTAQAFNNEKRPHILVWPEGAIYQKVMVIEDYKRRLIDYAKKHNAFIIVGAPGNDEGGYSTNSAYVVSNKGDVLGRYDKVKIIPFLEDYKAGRGYFPVKTKLGNLGIAICFESTYPQVVRRLVKNGSELLFVLTNDCGFGNSPLASMHAKDTVVRAVEARRYVVRADQSGVSFIVDPFGRVLKRYSGTAPYEIINATVSARYDETWYARFGDFLPLASLFICLGIMAVKR